MESAGANTKFNPFICSKVFYDPLLEVNYMVLSKHAKFFDEESGKSYAVLKQPKLVMNQAVNSNLFIFEGYDGYVTDCVCLNNIRTCVCEEVTFHIRKKSLQEEYCGIVPHVLKYGARYEALFPTFPSREEVQNMVKTKGCHETSKFLYATFCKSNNDRV